MYPAAVSRQILCVDDDRSILALAAEILRAEGITVWTAANGPQALHIAQHDPGITVAILDWHMPGMDGQQVAEGLHAISPEMKVVVLSGDSPTKVREAFTNRKVDQFLRKPFTPNTLVTTVRSLLAA